MSLCIKTGELAYACGGALFNCEIDKIITKIAISDTECVKNCAFVALKGEKHNGADFADSAVLHGASLIITEEEPKGIFPYLLVESSERALLEIAAYVRKKQIKRVIGVTGSVGKTTVKEMIHSILSGSFDFGKTEGNKNSTVGLPLSIFANAGREGAVFEMGISRQGEMEALTEAASPEIAVITGVSGMHASTLGGVSEIALEKSKVLLSPSVTAAVLPFGESRISVPSGLKTVTVGFENGADVKIENLRYTEKGGIFDLLFADGRRISSLFVPAFGAHICFDCALAAAAGELYGATENDIRCGLSAYKNAEMRQNILDIGGTRVMLDCYNAGPISVRASVTAFDIFCEQNGIVNKLLLLSDMLELGESSGSEHYALGEWIGRRGDCTLITYGEEAKGIALGALCAGLPPMRVHPFSREEFDKAGARLGELGKGGAVLIKGSRAMRAERFLDFICGTDGGENG